jgi:hypothetical protein
MDETLWPDAGSYDAGLLDESFFDPLMLSEWIDSFDVTCGDQANSEIAMAEDEVVPFLNDPSAADFTNDFPHFLLSYDVVPNVTITPQSGSVSSESSSTALPPLQTSSTEIHPASSVSLRKPEKRRFEEYLSEFVGTEPMNKTTKGRKQLSSEARKKAYQVRKAGACIRCRLMKTPVNHYQASHDAPDAHS